MGDFAGLRVKGGRKSTLTGVPKNFFFILQFLWITETFFSRCGANLLAFFFFLLSRFLSPSVPKLDIFFVCTAKRHGSSPQ